MGKVTGSRGSTARCRACATLTSDEQWRTMLLVRSMGAADLAAFIRTPWAGRSIEVRECARCGRCIARMVPPKLTGS